MPELSKEIQGERHLTSNNRIIRISAGSNDRESTAFTQALTITGFRTLLDEEKKSLTASFNQSL